MQSNLKTRQSLGRALAASLLLHALLVAVADLALGKAGERAKHSAFGREPRPSTSLSATLLKPPPNALPKPAAPPSLMLPPQRPVAKAKRQTPVAVPQRPPPAVQAVATSSVVVRQALSQLAEHLLYPVEAVNQGLEGEVLVMMFLDASGNVVAARVEKGSGHAILDQAAVAAARRLRSLPASASMEVLLPVRFRLN